MKQIVKRSHRRVAQISQDHQYTKMHECEHVQRQETDPQPAIKNKTHGLLASKKETQHPPPSAVRVDAYTGLHTPPKER